MPIVDLGGQRAERQAAILQMMNQMRNRSAGRESEMEKLAKEYEEQRRFDLEEARKERVAGAQIRGSEANILEGQKRSDLAEWQAGDVSSRGWREDQRQQQVESRAEEKFRDVELPLGHAQIEQTKSATGQNIAQTKEAEARTTLVQRQTEGEIGKNKREQDDALTKNARDIYNVGVANIQSGNPNAVSKDNIDHMVSAGRRLFGPSYDLPRDANGGLDKAKVPGLNLTTIGKDGLPSGDFAKDVRAAEKPNTTFESYVRAAQKSKAEGNEEAAKIYTEKIHEMSMPTLTKVEGMMLLPFAKAGDIDGYTNMKAKLKGTDAKGSTLKAGAALQQDIRDELDALASLRTVQAQHAELVKKGKFLTGSGMANMKIEDMKNWVGIADPEIAEWRAGVMDAVAKYRKAITGKASNVKEMGDLMKAVASEEDSVGTFGPKLQQTIDKTTRRIQTDLGAAKYFGIKVEDLPEQFGIISPAEAVKMWGSPDMGLPGGRELKAAYKLEQGTNRIGETARRTGQQIGGVGEFRGVSDQRQVETVVADLLQNGTPEYIANLQRTNPTLLKQAMEQIRGGQSAE